MTPKYLDRKFTMATKLYYYTTKDDYMCIYNLGLIWTCDGSYGDGVYLTNMSPNYGRMKIVEYLYSGQKDKYPNTEVCLETSAEKVNAVEMYSHSGHSIWISRNQLRFASFEFGHFWLENSVCKSIPLDSQIKMEHRNLSVTKSPMTQLKELLDRQGLMTDYKITRNNDIFICTATYRGKSADGTGRSQKSAKNEAAKCLIRQVLLDKPKIYSRTEKLEKDDKRKPLNHNNAAGNISNSLTRYNGQNWHGESKENCRIACNEENLRESNVSTNQTAEFHVCFLAENNILNNFIEKLQDIRTEKSSPVSAHKNISSGNVRIIPNRLLGSEVEDFTVGLSQNNYNSHNGIRNSVYTCGEASVANKISKQSIYHSNISTIHMAENHSSLRNENKSYISLTGRLQDLHVKQTSPASTHTHVPSSNIRFINGGFVSGAEDFIVSEKHHSSQNSEINGGPTCSDTCIVNTVSTEKLHDSKVLTMQTTATRTPVFGGNNSYIGLKERLQDIRINETLPVSTYKHLSSDNIAKIPGYDFEAAGQGIVGSQISPHSENCKAHSGTVFSEHAILPIDKYKISENMAKFHSYASGSRSDIIGSQKSRYPENSIRINENTRSEQNFRANQPSSVLMHKHQSSENMIEIPNCVVRAEGPIESIKTCYIENNVRNSGTTSRKPDILNNQPSPVLGYKYPSPENMTDACSFTFGAEGEGTLGSQKSYHFISSIKNIETSNRRQDIRINQSSSVPKYNHEISDKIAEVRSCIFGEAGESITGLQKITHSENSVFNKISKEISPKSSVTTNQRSDLRFKSLSENLQSRGIAQSTSMSSHEYIISEPLRSVFGPVTMGVAGSSLGLGKKPIIIIPPEEELQACLSSDPVPDASPAACCSEETNFQEVKDVAAVANPVGALQNLCAERHWLFPEYQEVPAVELNQGEFGSECSLLGFCERGVGYSKKLAKQQAALKVLQLVRNSVVHGSGK